MIKFLNALSWEWKKNIKFENNFKNTQEIDLKNKKAYFNTSGISYLLYSKKLLEFLIYLKTSNI